MTVPGLTIATQDSGSPLPLPMRVSSGLPETGLCGKMRMNRRPSRRRKCDAATRPASICRAVIQAALVVCNPNSPNATVLPRVALPFILPRWLLRNFTRLGIIGIGHLLELQTAFLFHFVSRDGDARHLPTAATRRATGALI